MRSSGSYHLGRFARICIELNIDPAIALSDQAVCGMISMWTGGRLNDLQLMRSLKAINEIKKGALSC